MLMKQVCAAVQHAHQKGVVHRDLKPGNVLVSDDDGRRQIKIIDFGLAKAMGQKLTEATLFTERGQIVGTPEYMAPEQADPSNQDIDTRADIYSLGVILYQLLVEALPFHGPELRRAGMVEIQRVLREVDPPKPSTKLASMGPASTALARTRRISVLALTKALRNDLDWVVMKALEKERNRRYDTANALAADLQRFLDHEPLVAGPPSAGYRLKKLVRRYRSQFLAASLVFLALLLGAITTSYLWLENSKLATAEAFAKRELQATVNKFKLVSTVVQYDRLLADEAALYGNLAESLPAIDDWLLRVDGLLDKYQQIQATIASLNESLDQQELAEAAEKIGAPVSSSTRPAAETAAILRDALARLLRDRDFGLLQDKKVSVLSLRIWAINVRQLTRAHPNARHSWAEVRRDIAGNPNYAGVDLKQGDDDVLGLVPIGRNPVTGLWEFYDLISAWDGISDPAGLAIPEQHPETGVIGVDGETGIVFVLLPGGAVTQGSQAEHASEPFFDPLRRGGDENLHHAELSPFLIARHEMTQGQWVRLCRWLAPDKRNPSQYRAGLQAAGAVMTLAHPVEMVTWFMADEMLSRYGMALPTEAQWEYAGRGGSTTQWAVPKDQLVLAANLADAAAREAQMGGQWEEWRDGYIVHAPTGTFPPERVRASRCARQCQRVVPRRVYTLWRRAARRWSAHD